MSQEEGQQSPGKSPKKTTKSNPQLMAELKDATEAKDRAEKELEDKIEENRGLIQENGRLKDKVDE